MQAKSRGGHRGKNITEVLQDAEAKVIRGDLADHVAVPTGFDRLDASINGGLRKSELLLLGGAPGVGKTIASLQIARNMASLPGHYVIYLSYEHTEIHLFHRLLCLESMFGPATSERDRVTLKFLHRLIEDNMNTTQLGEGRVKGFVDILRSEENTSVSLDQMAHYANRLVLLSASSRTTDLDEIYKAVTERMDLANGNVTLFIDYLQRVSVSEQAANEEEKVTIVVEGLKALAMSLNIPVWSIVAASREGLQADRLHLHHLRGSSALDYECDIAVIMNNKFGLVHKNLIDLAQDPGLYRKWVVFTIEKNRAGAAFQQLEFELVAQHFGFIPKGNPIRSGQLIGERSDGM